MDQTSMVNQSVLADIPTADKQSKTKTIYDSSLSSIFWKNLVAGFARALGGLIIWSILILFSGYFFVNQIWPQIHPLITSYQQLVETFTQTSSGTNNNLPKGQVNDLLDEPAVQDLLNRINQK